MSCDLYCAQYNSYWGTYPPVNTVKDYRVLENQQDPGNVSLRQNINTKHVRLENDSEKDILVGIDVSVSCQPRKKFILHGGQVRDLAVNLPDETTQFVWLYDPMNGQLLNNPHPIRRHINQMAIKEGTNNFWIMDFRQRSFHSR